MGLQISLKDTGKQIEMSCAFGFTNILERCGKQIEMSCAF
jgi:hypothetical protein